MALFTDAEIITIDDLTPFEASLLQVASSHGINIDQKISLATTVVAEKLRLLLADAAGENTWGFNRPVLSLAVVVVTPPLRRWLCFETLSRFFAEAYNAQLNTRFDAKWKDYQAETRGAADQTLQAGLGIVLRPLPKPQMPEVSVLRGVAPAESLYVRTSWVDTQGNESAPSPINAVVAYNQSSISVQMAEGALQYPATAFGWNVYVGSDLAGVTLQNGNPLAIGSTWSLPASGIVNGSLPGDGQKPDQCIPISRQIRRG